MCMQSRGSLRDDSCSSPAPDGASRDGRPGVAWLVVALITTCTTPVGAVRRADSPTNAEISVPGAGAVSIADRERRALLQSGTPWREFTARRGAWTALWNARTASPHRAFGPSIPLPGFADRADVVERAVRAFIAGHPGVFGSPTLETIRVRKAGRT